MPAVHVRRWQHGGVRRLLRPASRLALDPWVTQAGRTLTGLVLNIGAGEDSRVFGRRTLHFDRYAPAVTVRGDITQSLPFRSGTIDAVLCTEVLEHLPNPIDALREMARVLKPQGVAVVTVPFVFHYHKDPEDYARFTPDGLRVALEQAGFEVQFLAGTGGKMVALLMLLESVHVVAKLCVRSLIVPARSLFARVPRNGTWSDYASNVVALARIPRARS